MSKDNTQTSNNGNNMKESPNRKINNIMLSRGQREKELPRQISFPIEFCISVFYLLLLSNEER
jgi:hypothetical protein